MTLTSTTWASFLYLVARFSRASESKLELCPTFFVCHLSKQNTTEGHGKAKNKTMKKTFILALACAAVCSINTTNAQNPTQINIDPSCPATVTANTTTISYGTTASTVTVNNSQGYDARTTVIDDKGNQSNYHTGPQTKTLYDDGKAQSDTWTRETRPNSHVKSIDVTCSPAEK